MWWYGQADAADALLPGPDESQGGESQEGSPPVVEAEVMDIE